MIVQFEGQDRRDAIISYFSLSPEEAEDFFLFLKKMYCYYGADDAKIKKHYKWWKASLNEEYSDIELIYTANEKCQVLLRAIEALNALTYQLKEPLPDTTHVEQLRGYLPLLVADMKAGFVEATGEDPWLVWDKTNELILKSLPGDLDDPLCQPIEMQFKFNVGDTVMHQPANKLFPIQRLFVVKCTAYEGPDGSVSNNYRCQPDWVNESNMRFLNYWEHELTRAEEGDLVWSC